MSRALRTAAVGRASGLTDQAANCERLMSDPTATDEERGAAGDALAVCVRRLALYRSMRAEESDERGAAWLRRIDWEEAS